MAVAWLKVLKSVPWGEVISAAPQVASSARRLWETVGRKGAPEPNTEFDEAVARMPTDDGLAMVAAQVEQQDIAIAQLHGQLREASKLIAELADQNAQLIAKLQAARERLTLIGFVAAASGVLGVVTLALVLART
jgi:type IV secretory pathway VirJ component